MKCVVTSVDTNNKWKGYPCHKSVILKANELVKNGKFMTVRKAVIVIQKRIKDGKTEKMSVVDYNALLKKVLELDNGKGN